jgi:hypothetical protein
VSQVVWYMRWLPWKASHRMASGRGLPANFLDGQPFTGAAKIRGGTKARNFSTGQDCLWTLHGFKRRF